MPNEKQFKFSLKKLEEIVERDMGSKLGISTLSEILKREFKWTENDMSNTYSRIPTSKHLLLEKSYIEWISRMYAINGIITEEVIIAKAQEFGQNLDITDLKFSHGWLHRFKQRYNLKLRTLHGKETASMSDKNIEQLRIEMSDRLEQFDPEILLNMDKTGLFFQAFPTRTIGSKERKGIKQSKVRVTVALCSNATGSIKIKLFLIGHSKKPRCFKDFKVDKYCHYYANCKAWMTTELFNSFWQHLSDELKPYKKEFVLLLDNGPSHNLIKDYENLKIIMLPKNSTAHLQPMDAGIIRNFKLFYRKKSIIDYMASLERGTHFSVDLRKAVQMIHNARMQVKSRTIIDYFQKSGIIKSFEKENTNEDQLIEKDQIIKQNFEEIEAILDEESVEETGDVQDDHIVNLFKESYDIDLSIIEAEEGTSIPKIRPVEVLDAIDTLLETKMAENYFSQFLSTNTIKELKDLREEVETFLAANKRQSTLNEFVNK